MRSRPRSLLANAYACASALTLVIVLTVAFLADYLHGQYITDTQRSLASLSTVLSDQADRALQTIELVQQNVLDEITASGAENEAEFVAFASTLGLHQTLRTRITALPQINAITIIDNHGKLLNFSRFWPIPDVNISDRDYFQAISQDPALERYVSQPVANRANGKWTLYIARRISGPKGNFLGLVLGAVELDYFQSLYSQISPARDFVFSLFRTDGMLLVRSPPRPNSVGNFYNRAGPQLVAAASHAGGVIRATSPIDHLDRLLSSQALAHFPIRFSVSRTVDAALARWRDQVVALVVVGLAIEAALLCVVWLAIRTVQGQRRLARSEAARRQAEERARNEGAVREHFSRFGTALDNMAQGLCMLDDRGRLVVANDQLARILGLAHLPEVDSVTRQLLRFVLPDRLLPTHETRSIIAQIRRSHARHQPMHTTMLLHSGRSVLLHVQPLQTGGLLLTLSDVTEQRRAEAKIAFLAHYDTLTELPNRNSLLADLERNLQRRGADGICAVLSINLQRFREINDTFGRAVGDLLLKAIAARLRAAAARGDLIAHLGGDEFALVVCLDNDLNGSVCRGNNLDRSVNLGSGLPGCQSQLAGIADRLREDLTVPCELEGRVVAVAVRIGVALAPDNAETAEALLQAAQLAMHCARVEADDQPRFFRTEMVGAMQARRQMETDLLAALHAGELELHYQPLIRLSSRQVVGFEALLRWRHPERGLVPPGDFIPLAEQTGLIVPIGEWALRTACVEAATWPSDRKLAVNLSAVQVRDRRLVPSVRAILEQTGLPPARLELEITETVLLSDSAETLEVLHELRRLGISIALDDFGTGFSSLSYLRSFPFDKVKIDRAFIRDLGTSRDARAIVHAILGLCAELGINTLAEGIELDEQADALIAEGCRDGQGFLFGRATPSEHLAPFLRSTPILSVPVLEPLS